MADLMTRARDALAMSAMQAIATYAVSNSVPAALAALIGLPQKPTEPDLEKER
jgi:hypothetical protein